MKSVNEYEKILETDYPDLARARQKRRVWELLKFVALELLSLMLIVTSRGATPVLWLLLLVPFLLAKPHRVLKSGYAGRIVKREFYTKRKVKGVGMGRKNSRGVGRGGEIPLMVLKILDEKEKLHSLELPEKYQGYFTENDKVLVLSGFEYPIMLSKKEKAFCPLCGTVTPYETCFCGGLCGMPLLELADGEE